jgi:hypothetical protein
MEKTRSKSIKSTAAATATTNVNDILVEGKSKRGKKKSVADDFEGIGVTTTTIKEVKPIPMTENKKIIKKSEGTEETYNKNGYSRPAVTMTDQLSKEQIEELLEDYKKVDDIYQVPLGVHMRYFSNIDGKMVFRRGGLLHKNTGLPEFVILAQNPTGKPGWSVQVKDTIFYRKMTLGEIKNEYQSIIEDLIEKNKKLKDELKKLKK